MRLITTCVAFMALGLPTWASTIELDFAFTVTTRTICAPLCSDPQPYSLSSTAVVRFANSITDLYVSPINGETNWTATYGEMTFDTPDPDGSPLPAVQKKNVRFVVINTPVTTEDTRQFYIDYDTINAAGREDFYHFGYLYGPLAPNLNGFDIATFLPPFTGTKWPFFHDVEFHDNQSTEYFYQGSATLERVTVEEAAIPEPASGALAIAALAAFAFWKRRCKLP
ncbi:MAG: hypothetical protein JO182_16660 [Acidobacteriaceae bacterium]|nr:hypothetical protein [Acidobacteriaceae bacterium]